jgi:4-amino-4-deoxy-L-arabinose transferase-like glycosyltransferase
MKENNNRLVYILVFAFFCSIIAFHLISAAAGYPQYRDIHLGTALEYAKGRIDLLRPIIVGFNANNMPTPQELPVWQAIAGLVFKILGSWLGWANVVSLAIFATGLWPMFQLAKQYLGDRTALWTLLCLMFQPIVFLYAGMAATDGFVLICTIWFLYFADKLVRSGALRWFLPAAVLGSLTAVSKLPYMVMSGIALCLLTMVHAKWKLRPWVLLGAVGVIAAIIFTCWSRYCDHVYGLALFPQVDLRLTNPQMRFWFFGDWHYRLSPFNWGKGGWGALNSLLGSFALAGLAGWSLFFSKNRLGQSLFLGSIITTLVFSHLVLHHRHYYLFYSPAIAILCAEGITKLEGKIAADYRQRSIFTALLGAILGLATIQGLMGIKIISGYDPYVVRIERVLREQTSPQDKLLLQGDGWGGEMFFLANRTGLSMQTTAILEDPDNVQRLKSLGFNKLVMINESPLLAALQQVDPGDTSREQQTYQQFITATPKTWPTVFQNNDLLIKAIP